MQLEVGAIIEGKVTGITKFGAFVALPDGRSGLVHISEVANTYVNDVHDYVQDGQTVKVRVISIGADGKINLSIKKAEDRPAPQPRSDGRPQRSSPPPKRFYREPAPRANGPSGDASFEDKLKQFMQESDNRMADNRLYADHRPTNRRRK